MVLCHYLSDSERVKKRGGFCGESWNQVEMYTSNHLQGSFFCMANTSTLDVCPFATYNTVEELTEIVSFFLFIIIFYTFSITCSFVHSHNNECRLLFLIWEKNKGKRKRNMKKNGKPTILNFDLSIFVKRDKVIDFVH